MNGFRSSAWGTFRQMRNAQWAVAASSMDRHQEKRTRSRKPGLRGPGIRSAAWPGGARASSVHDCKGTCRMGHGFSPLRWWTGAANAAKTDRKSTRLNSSHSQISYAVFCLKKKKKKSKKI